MAEQGLKINIGADITDFQKGVAQVDKSLTNLGKSAQQVRPSFIGLNQTLRDSGNFAISTQIGFLAISNNLPTLVDDFSRFRKELTATSKESVSFGSALRQFAGGFLGSGGLIALVGVAATVLPILAGKFLQSKAAADKAKESNKDFSDTLKSINGQIAGEATRVSELVSVLRNESETRSRKVAALKELNRLQPEYFGQLKEEKGLINGLEGAYRNYLASLFDLGKARAASKQIENLFTELLNIEQKLGKDEIKTIVNPADLGRAQALADQLGKLGIDVNNLTGDITSLTLEQSKLLRQYTALAQGARSFDASQESNGLRKRKKDIENQILGLQALTAAQSKFVKVTEKEAKKLKAAKISSLSIDIATIEFTNTQPALNAALEEVRKKRIATENVAINIPLKLEVPKNAFDSLTAFANSQSFKLLQEKTAGITQQFNDFLAPAINTVFGALENGSSITKALQQSFKALLVQIAATVAKSLILAAILNAVFPGGAAIGGATVKGFGAIFGSLLKGAGGVSSPSFGGVAGGGFQLVGNVAFTQRGTDLVGVLNSGNSQIRRVG